ncbi:membrane protein [Rhodopirellula europaea 6C]|uniref:Membrane protein n=1 Tax=Rhodopirellula europaea 6C TaxID=1263867 RepID=M2A9P2_9BACT|nr:membrane protein [Rhodopirellula europaea 6C]
MSAIIGLTFAWQTLVVYAFSTMVDPQIRGGDRAKMIADRFLFGDGPFQIVIVCMLIYLAATGLISAMLFSTFAIWRQPTLKVGTMISCSAGGLVTLSIVGCFLTR